VIRANPRTLRTIRVFVSSTFVDMQIERDELVKRAFPVLRDMCESRGVVWGEVDLRWGITAEEAAEGRVLDLCLDEIRECRPFFIGLLGERYGWVPDAIDPRLAAREPWLREHSGASVTELEVLHGVLADPSLARDAFFYFRDPAYATRRLGFEEIATELDLELWGSAEASARAHGRRDRLRSLKDRIRASGATVREAYPNPQSLSELVLDDFAALIDRRFPPGAKRGFAESERAVHAAFAHSREEVYVARPEYFARLDQHAAEGSGALAITGAPGIGKSALLANWLVRRATGTPPVIAHFVAAHGAGATWPAMVRRLITEIGELLDLPVEIPDDVDELRGAFATTLQRAAGRGPLVITIDALDQLERRDDISELTWLPHVLPDNVRLIVSTLAGPALDEIERRGWPALDVAPLTPPKRRELLDRYLGGYGKRLPVALTDRIVAAPQAGSPLFVRVLLEELRVYGDHETLARRLDALLWAADIPTLFELVFQRWEADYERGRPGLVGDALKRLWAARRGLSEAELLDLLSSDAVPVPRAIWSPLYLAAKHMLINREGLLALAHRFAREAVERRYLPDLERRSVHLHLAEYFLDGLPTRQRSIDEAPWQLKRAGQWHQLFNLLSRAEVTLALARASRADLRAYWSTLEAASDFRMIDAYVRIHGQPESHSYSELMEIARLLLDAGHPRAALSVYKQVEQCCSNSDELQMCLGWQGVVLRTLGEFDGALEVLAEQQVLCQQIGNMLGLQVSLGNQALVLRTRGDLDGALKLLEEQERVARANGARDVLAQALGNQATIARQRGDATRALTLHHEEETILREAGNVVALQFALGNQSLALQQRGDINEALDLMIEQEAMARRYGIPAGVQQALGNRASILSDLGDLDGALELLERQDAICREGDLREQLSHALSSRAAALSKRGDFDRSLLLLDEAEQITRELGAPEDTQHVLGNRVAILLQRGALNDALDQVRERARICHALANPHSLQAAIGQHAVVLWLKGDTDGAFELSTRQSEMCRALGDPRALQLALGNHGILLRRRGELDRARTAFEEQEQICRELRDRDGLTQSLGNQATLASERDDRKTALELLRQVEDAARQLDRPDALQFALGNKAAILIDDGDLDGAVALLREQEMICRTHGLLEGLRLALRNQLQVLWQRGEHTSALSRANEHAEICRQLGNRAALADALSICATLLLKSDEHEQAMALYAEQQQLCEELDDRTGTITAQLNQAISLAHLGRSDQAVALAGIAKDLARRSGLAELHAQARSTHRRLRLAQGLRTIGPRPPQ
jgi:nephrocystin-3